MVLGKKSITYTKSVLVTGYTAEGIFLSVENEAVFGIDLKASAAESCGYRINVALAAYDGSLCRVEVGITSAVPEVYVFNFKCNDLVRGVRFSDEIAFLVADFKVILIRSGKRSAVNLDLNLCILTLNCGGDLDAGCAVVVKVEMYVGYGNDVYISVRPP